MSSETAKRRMNNVLGHLNPDHSTTTIHSSSMPISIKEPPYVVSNAILSVDVNKQSVPIGNSIWRNAGFPNALVYRTHEHLSTPYHSLKEAVQKYSNQPCLGKRSIKPDGTAGPYEWITYSQFYTRVKNVAAGLIYLGVKPKDHIGIWSKNRIEWQVVAEGAITKSMVTISLYDTLGEESSEYIINHGELICVCCSNETLPKLLRILPKCPKLKFIICFDEIPQGIDALIPIYTLNQVEEFGAQNPAEDIPPKPSDLYTIMYTSGTTGMPKGVMITQGNMTAVIAANQVHVLNKLLQTPGEHAILGFLPLAHIFERLVEAISMQNGVKIGYWQGDLAKIGDDIKELKPSVLATVPRVLDKMYDAVKAGIESQNWLSKYIFETAYDIKRESYKKGEATPWSDWLVFDKIKQNLGGNMQLIFSSGAPLRPEVQEFITIAFNVPVVQAYGLTEVSGSGTIQLSDDFSFGHVGSVVPCVELKLESVPEMNYFITSNPPAGEICFRGPSVSIGYYKDEEKTKEVFQKDGWFHTGDIAKILPNGTVVIVDRKKNIFKLAQGEYVAAENIENKLGQSKLLSKLWVYGDSFRHYLVGVGVVNPPIFLQFAKANGFSDVSPQNIKQLLNNKKLKELVLKDLARIAKENKLQGFEMIKAIHLVDFEFETIGAVTPTLKLQRSVLKNYFQKEINEMYAENN